MRISHGKGVDDISLAIVVGLTTLASITHPLSEIINWDLPNALKIAKIVPDFKIGDREEVSIHSKFGATIIL